MLLRQESTDLSVSYILYSSLFCSFIHNSTGRYFINPNLNSVKAYEACCGVLLYSYISCPRVNFNTFFFQILLYFFVSRIGAYGRGMWGLPCSSLLLYLAVSPCLTFTFVDPVQVSETYLFSPMSSVWIRWHRIQIRPKVLSVETNLII